MFFPCRCHYSGSVLAHSLQYILRFADVNNLSIIQHDGVWYRTPRQAVWTISFWQWALFLLGMVLKGKKLRGNIASFGWMALANGGHTAGGEGAFRVQTKAVCPERTMTAAAPALWIRAVCSAVILIAGLVPHEAFKGTMIAIGKIHVIPPFGLN